LNITRTHVISIDSGELLQKRGLTVTRASANAMADEYITRMLIEYYNNAFQQQWQRVNFTRTRATSGDGS